MQEDETVPQQQQQQQASYNHEIVSQFLSTMM
jgi:hypothetical protein